MATKRKKCNLLLVYVGIGGALILSLSGRDSTQSLASIWYLSWAMAWLGSRRTYIAVPLAVINLIMITGLYAAAAVNRFSESGIIVFGMYFGFQFTVIFVVEFVRATEVVAARKAIRSSIRSESSGLAQNSSENLRS